MAEVYDNLLHQIKTKVMGYLMMCLGLVELALNSKCCSDWDYTKKEGTKSCWDNPLSDDLHCPSSRCLGEIPELHPKLGSIATMV